MKDKVYQELLKGYMTFNHMHLSKDFFQTRSEYCSSQNCCNLNTKQIYKIYKAVVQNFIVTVTFLDVLFKPCKIHSQ